MRKSHHRGKYHFTCWGCEKTRQSWKIPGVRPNIYCSPLCR